jgi:hypothetical protein
VAFPSRPCSLEEGGPVAISRLQADCGCQSARCCCSACLFVVSCGEKSKVRVERRVRSTTSAWSHRTSCALGWGHVARCSGVYTSITSSRKGFVAEVKRMRRWYKGGRRLTRRHRVLRGPAGPEVRGRKSVWNGKLTTHYRRFLGKVRMRGLWRWRRCALALHRAGVAVSDSIGLTSTSRGWQSGRGGILC